MPTSHAIRSTTAALRQAGLVGLLLFLAVLGTLTVVVRLSRLVGDSGTPGALPITFLSDVTRAWWQGNNVYAEHRSGVVYPPTTWVLLGPIFGSTTLGVARWLWAAASMFGLAALGAALAGAVSGSGRVTRACAWLAPFSMPAFGDALATGALITVLLPLAVWSVLVATRPAPSWTGDVAAAGMFDLALADPGLALPFFGPLLAGPGRMRPAALAVAGYGVLTAVAAYVHAGGFFAEIRLWTDHLQRQAGRGYGNVQDWLLQLGWPDAFASASVILSAAVGVFLWRCRRTDAWLLLGVAATTARMWMAPRIDADALLIIPLIAVARAQARRLPPLTSWHRGVLLLSALTMWVPLQFHFVGSTIGPLFINSSWVRLFNASHVAVFVLLMIVLVTSAVFTRDGAYARSWTELPRNA